MPAGCVGSAARSVRVGPGELATLQRAYAQPPDAVRRAVPVALMDCGFTARGSAGEGAATWMRWRIPSFSRGNSPGHRGGCRVEAQVQVAATGSETVVRLHLVQDLPRDLSTGRPVPVEEGARVDRSLPALPLEFFTRLEAALRASDAGAFISTNPQSQDPVVRLEESPAEALDTLGAALAERGFEVTVRDPEAGVLAAGRVAYAKLWSWDSMHWESTCIVTVLARATGGGTVLRLKTSDHHVETFVPEFARQLEERLRGPSGPAR